MKQEPRIMNHGDMAYFKKPILGILSGLLLGMSVHAQMLPAPVSLIPSSASPSPGERVTISAATPTFDTDRAFFDWTVAGKAQPGLSGQAKNSIELTAGDTGSVMRVSVSVSSPTGGGEASLVMRVSDLSLTWVSETSVPLWYRGKALPASGAVVNIAAIPDIVIDGRHLRPADVIYRWTLDDQNNALSGLGKQVFRIRISDMPKTTHQVRVIIEDTDRTVRKEARLIITPASPRVLIYPSTPLGGIEPRTANYFPAAAAKGLIDLMGESFFFPTQSRENLIWQWDLAGNPLQSLPAGPSLAMVDASRLPSGDTPVTLRVQYAQSLIPQSASKVIHLFLP